MPKAKTSSVLRPLGQIYSWENGQLGLKYWFPGIEEKHFGMDAYLNPGDSPLGISYEQWLKHRTKQRIHLWRLRGTLPGMIGAPRRIRITSRSWWFLMHRCRKPKHIPGKPITKMDRRYLRKDIAFLKARLLDERIEFTSEARRLIKKDIDQIERLLLNRPKLPKSHLVWRKKPHPLKAIVEAFNEGHKMDAYELNPKQLQRKPQNEIGKDGWFCEYSLFYVDGSPVLASYCGHRMTNSHYKEIDASGQSIYHWDDWGGMIFGSDYSPEYLAEWRETRRRGKRAGIKCKIAR